MGKMSTAIIFIVMLLVGCQPEPDGPGSSQIEQEATETQQKRGTEHNDPEDRKQLGLDEKFQDAPSIPESFEDSTAYKGVGRFAGKEYEIFEDDQELANVLKEIPKLTEENDTSTSEQLERYLFSLFKEDLNPVQVPINQWASIQSKSSEVESSTVKWKDPSNIAIVLDASGSMANMDNGQTKIEVVEESLHQFVEDLPERTNISLHVYGYVGTGTKVDREKYCSTIDEVYSLGTYDKHSISDALNRFELFGWTPVAKAIQTAQESFNNNNEINSTNTFYLVSDGIVTCDGDSVESIRKLNETDVDPVVNVAGYQIDVDGRPQLKKRATIEEGRYSNARNEQDLQTEFTHEVGRTNAYSKWQEAMSAFNETVKEQLNEWRDEQIKRVIREDHNLKAVTKYLKHEGIIDSSLYLQWRGDYVEYSMKMNEQIREMYLEFIQLNRDAYLKNSEKLRERYLEEIE